jgi:hypothetical protein
MTTLRQSAKPAYFAHMKPQIPAYHDVFTDTHADVEEAEDTSEDVAFSSRFQLKQ